MDVAVAGFAALLGCRAAEGAQGGRGAPLRVLGAGKEPQEHASSQGCLNSCLGFCTLSPAPECCSSVDSGAQTWAMAFRNVQGHCPSVSEQH